MNQLQKLDAAYPLASTVTGVVVAALAIALLSRSAIPAAQGISAVLGIIVAVVFMIAAMNATVEKSAMLYSRCFGKSKKFWRLFCIICFVIIPLYPLVCTPLFLLAALRLLFGGC